MGKLNKKKIDMDLVKNLVDKNYYLQIEQLVTDEYVKNFESTTSIKFLLADKKSQNKKKQAHEILANLNNKKDELSQTAMALNMALLRLKAMLEEKYFDRKDKEKLIEEDSQFKSLTALKKSLAENQEKTKRKINLLQINIFKLYVIEPTKVYLQQATASLTETNNFSDQTFDELNPLSKEVTALDDARESLEKLSNAIQNETAQFEKNNTVINPGNSAKDVLYYYHRQMEIIEQLSTDLPPESVWQSCVRNLRKFANWAWSSGLLDNARDAIQAVESLTLESSIEIKQKSKFDIGADAVKTWMRGRIADRFIFKVYEPWSVINVPGSTKRGKLILGKLPDQGDLAAIRKLCGKHALTGFVSVIKRFELYTKVMSTKPITPEDLKKEGIEQCHIDMLDHSAKVKMDDVIRGVNFIKEKIDKGESVLVHCKQGRGRSNMIALCYLIQEEIYPAYKDKLEDMVNSKLEEGEELTDTDKLIMKLELLTEIAYKIVKSQRAIVALSESKAHVIHKFIMKQVMKLSEEEQLKVKMNKIYEIDPENLLNTKEELAVKFSQSESLLSPSARRAACAG